MRIRDIFVKWISKILVRNDSLKAVLNSRYKGCIELYVILAGLFVGLIQDGAPEGTVSMEATTADCVLTSGREHRKKLKSWALGFMGVTIGPNGLLIADPVA